MKRYMAPMEGITGYIFRNAFAKYYGGTDKYFAPFMSPADNCAMNPKERRDVIPENNHNINLVPQILTCKSHHFIAAVKELQVMGYEEINLNLGCPSGTVCAKNKGAGFLTKTDELEQFLDEIYRYAEQENIKISLKTRIGRYSPEEWEELLRIYNQYPVYELIIHPRVALDYYNGEPRMEAFDYAMKNSENPIVYNGNLFSIEKIKDMEEEYDMITALMFGRGLLYNPELLSDSKAFDYKRFRNFHDEIYYEYQKIMAPDIHVLYRMKELWTYWKVLFPDCEKEVKKILKAKKYGDYEAGLRQIGL